MTTYIATLLFMLFFLVTACSMPPKPYNATEHQSIQAITAKGEPGVLPRYEPLENCFARPPEALDLVLDIDCGYVIVPEFYTGKSSRELKLGVTRLNSREKGDASPLFMLAGGPGQAQAAPEFFALFQPELLGGILAKRDIVLVEQRGTVHSEPQLDCPALPSASWVAYEKGLTPEDTYTFQEGLIQSCIHNLRAQGINFDAYNSVENAADVNAVRAALGYDKLIYYGASYGAQLGQHVMRDFPEILEAAVLDGANALSRKSWVEDRALDAQWGLDNLTALCEADEKCRENYDIPALVNQAMGLFDNGPLSYTYTSPDDPETTISGTVNEMDMVGLIYGQQGTRIGAMSMPATLLQLVEGGPELVANVLGSVQASKLLASRYAVSSPEILLMHLAMVCSDDPVKSVSEVNITGTGRYATLFGQTEGEQYEKLCSLIDVTGLPDSTDVNVTGDIATLLLSGDLDVATPTFRSQLVADTLPNATLVVFPGRTHVQIAGVNLCAAQIMTQFVLDPMVSLDMSCTKENQKLGFVLPDGSMSQEGP